MGRRRKTGFFEDLFEVTAALPWWIGVLVAVVSFLIFHHLAGRAIPAGSPGNMAPVISTTIISGFSNVLQYVVPIVCLAGAAASVLARRKRRELLGGVNVEAPADSVAALSWQEFEMLIGEAFRMQGYSVTETGGGGADGGVDLHLRKGNEEYLVQCKQWRAHRVGVEVVRELYGVMAARGAAGGFVVSAGRFTEDARKFAQGRNIKLIDGTELGALIARARAKAVASGAGVPTTSAPTPQRGEVPSCPRCSSPMRRQIAKKGAHAGKAFWGCSHYPECRGIRPIAS